jgi:hypothetical protein
VLFRKPSLCPFVDSQLHWNDVTKINAECLPRQRGRSVTEAASRV